MRTQWSFFFREAFPPLLANSLVGFTLFTTYTVTEAALKYFPSEPVSQYYIPFISGATAGAAQSIVSSPLDNIRAVLASRSAKPDTVEWKGWRHIAVEALFPKWLTTTIPFKQSPVRFVLNWFKSTWSLFQFTLLRDSLGFAVFFSIFELSRSLAKRAGRAVDRFQANLKKRSQALGINLDLDAMLENDMIPRGWTGRVVQAFVIVMTGIFAGIGYGIVSRPFDHARTVVWNGLEEWSRRTRRQAKMKEAAAASLQADETIKASKKTATVKPVSTLSHRDKHARLTYHEHRLPVHPPRPAQPPRHPLKEPSLVYDDYMSDPSRVPPVSLLLREAYRRGGGLAMLGYQRSSKSSEHAVLSRSQRIKAQETNKSSTKSSLSGSKGKSSALEMLAEHPALGGTSVFDNLPDPTNDDLLPGKQQAGQKSHRKARWWSKARSRRKESVYSASIATAQRWSARRAAVKIFQIIPPYAFGFLVYATMAGDLSD